MTSEACAALRGEVEGLRRRVARMQAGMAAAVVVGLGLACAGWVRGGDPVPVQDEVRARKFVLVDDAGVVRAMLHQDPKVTDRRSRSAGLTVFDATGAERGGFATFDDKSVVMAMDAPRGVGHPMPDRVGVFVGPDGSAHIMLLDNETRAVARMDSDGKGAGGFKVFKWDDEAKKIHTKAIRFAGEEVTVQEMGERK